MGLYLPSGFLDVSYLDQTGTPFNIIVGGRGIGKTYGLLRYYLERKESIFYLRRRDTEAKIAASKTSTPYKKLAMDMGFSYEMTRTIVKGLEVDFETPWTAAYFGALANFANVRGFDASDCTAIIYDEFIPERSTVPIKDEGSSLLNVYETINRNRELEGAPPVKMWMVSNANRIDSPIFAELGIMRKMLHMQQHKIEREVVREKGLQLVHCTRSPVSVAKAGTALYQLVDSGFKDMALNNSYRAATDNIKSKNLNNFDPIVRIGELCIYRQKNDELYYCSSHASGTVPKYGTGETEVNRFCRRYGFMVDLYQLGYMTMESIEIDYIFRTILHI